MIYKHALMITLQASQQNELNIAPSSSGRTLDFGSRNAGSNPAGASKLSRTHGLVGQGRRIFTPEDGGFKSPWVYQNNLLYLCFMVVLEA